MSHALPKEWLVAVLGVCAQNVNGARKPISLSKRALLSGHFPYLGATGKIDSLNDYTHEGEHVLVGEDGANLVTKSKNLSFIYDGKFWVNNHAHAIKCVAGVPAKYLSNYINSLDLKPFVTGSAQPKLTKTNLEKIPVPMAPLAEQQEIVAQLDKLLSQAESTKTRLDAIPAILKRFRQSVLAAAVSGKLTEEWRHANGIPSSKNMKLGEAIELTYGKSLPAKIRTGEGWPVFGSNGVVGLHKDSLVKGPFVIVGRKGSFGQVTWSEDSGWPIDTTYYVVLKISLNLKFVFYMLKTLGLTEMNRSTAIPGLNREDAYSCQFEYPNLVEQNEIVRRVDELFACADKIVAQVNAAQYRVNNLTQSLLDKAFSGELTAKWRTANPELISGENSAEALLEKIKAERELIKNQPKPKRTSVKKKTGSSMSKQMIKVVDALKEAGKPLSGQQLLASAGYPSDSSTYQLESFFLDLRDALTVDKSIVKVERDDDEQDWFTLAEVADNE